MICFIHRQAPIGDDNYLLLAARARLDQSLRNVDPSLTLRNYDSLCTNSMAIRSIDSLRGCSSLRGPKSSDQDNVYTMLTTPRRNFDNIEESGKRQCEEKDFQPKKSLSQMNDRLWSS